MTTYYNDWQQQCPPVYGGFFYPPMMDSPGLLFQQPFFPPFQHQPPLYGPGLTMAFAPSPMPPPYNPTDQGRPRTQGRGRRGPISPEPGADACLTWQFMTQPGWKFQEPGDASITLGGEQNWTVDIIDMLAALRAPSACPTSFGLQHLVLGLLATSCAGLWVDFGQE